MSVDQQPQRSLSGGQIALLAVAIGAGCLGGCFGLLVEPLRPAGALVLTAIFAAWMAYAARGAGWRRMAITGLLVFAALAGLETAVFLPDLRRVGIGVVLAVLCVSVALLTRSAWPTRWVSVTLVAVLGSVGGMAVAHVRTALVGTLLILAAVGIIVHLVLGLWVRRHVGRSRRRAAALAVVGAVLIPLGLAAFVANDVRQGGAYARRYGTQVSVNTGDVCEFTVSLGTHVGDSTSALRCPALWAVNGGYRSGTAFGDGPGFGPGEPGLTAYALGDRAFHTSLTTDDGLTLLARAVPGWLVGGVFVGLAIAVMIALTSHRPNLARPYEPDPFELPSR
jgi:hypothetical protein